MSCRESKSDRLNTDSVSLSVPASPVNDIIVRSGSATEGYSEQVKLRGAFTEYPRVSSDSHGTIFSGHPSTGTLQANFPFMSSDRSADSWDGIPQISSSVASRFSPSSSVEMVDDSFSKTERNETAFDPSGLRYFNFDPYQSSAPSIVSKSCYFFCLFKLLNHKQFLHFLLPNEMGHFCSKNQN